MKKQIAKLLLAASIGLLPVVMHAQDNVLRCKADEVIGDDTLLMDMDWLISGVTSLE